MHCQLTSGAMGKHWPEFAAIIAGLVTSV